MEQKIGDFYAACMDEKTIDAKGTAPLKTELDRIAAMQRQSGHESKRSARLHRSDVSALFNFSSGPDFKNAGMEIAQLGQGGLGLPDRDYYFKDDAKLGRSAEEIRGAYRAEPSSCSAIPRKQAAEKAQAVMEIETAMAKASMDRVARRDPETSITR